MSPDSDWVWRMSGLARDGTAQPVSRDEIFRRERDTEIIFRLPRGGLATITVDAQSAKNSVYDNT